MLAGENAIKSYTDLFRKLLRRFQWRNIYVVLDSSAKPFHLLLAPNLNAALSNDGGREVKYTKTSETIDPDFNLTLRDIRGTSRGMFLRVMEIISN